MLHYYYDEDGNKLVKYYWYAVVRDNEDNDWGTGSYDPNEAVAMAETYGDDAYIVVVEEGQDPIAVDEIKRVDGEWDIDINELAQTYPAWGNKYYYWLDTENDLLHRGEFDEKGDEDRDTEEIILRDVFEDAGINTQPEDDEEREEAWAKVDAYIKKRLGFVPYYEIN